MTFPLWAFFGIGAALFSSCILLLQERFKVNGYALAVWNKVACASVMLPFVVVNGLPQHPFFYVFLGLGAMLWAVNDVVFFTGLAKVGAGSVSRLIPAASIISFLLWFVVSPALLDKYLASPVISTLIFLTLCGSAFCAMRLKKCAVSMQALRAMWFVIVAAAIGPLFAKMTTRYAGIGQGPYAYVFCEALMMISLWLIYLAVKKPVPLSVFTGSCRRGLLIGTASACMVLLNVTAYYHVDNPGYIPAIKALDSVMILFVYKLWSRKTEGDIVSGLGLVACAAALIILKAQV